MHLSERPIRPLENATFTRKVCYRTPERTVRLKIASLLPSASVLLLTAAVLAATTDAHPQQDSQPAPASTTQGPGGGRPMRNFPAPTNLKVLPKDLTGAQVRDMMEKWAGSLGVHCDTCHTADPNNVGPNGRPRLNFADDSKPDKQIARIMYTMTQQMNTDYISKAMDLDKNGEGTPVTCGTCHRGHKMPEEFVIPPEQRPGPGAGPRGAPAGGTMPPGGPPPTN